jgi:hypothetical protein
MNRAATGDLPILLAKLILRSWALIVQWPLLVGAEVDAPASLLSYLA